MKNNNRISVVIAVHNEADKIEKCLKTVNWVDEIIIVDGESTDDTVEICSRYTDKIFIKDNPPNFDLNKVFGMGKAKNEWILIWDADEYMPIELKKEIILITSSNPKEIGFFIPRINYIYGKEWKGKKDYQMRLFKNGKANYVKNNLHSLINIDGEVGFLSNYFHHNAVSNLESRYNKINQYTTIEAYCLLNDNEVKINTINCVWYLLLKPFLIGMRLYFSEQNYKNGIAGIIWSINGSYYCFSKYSKVWESKYLKRSGREVD